MQPEGLIDRGDDRLRQLTNASPEPHAEVITHRTVLLGHDNHPDWVSGGAR